MTGYPATVAEVLQDHPKFPAAVLRAMRAFRAAHPWRQTNEAREALLRSLLDQLAAAYSIPVPRLVCLWGTIDCYHRTTHTIFLDWSKGPSVVTCLHEFAHARGMDERQACRWSINLFRRMFPASYRKLAHVGHMLRRRRDA